jgi:hypothetical protein
VLKNKIERSDGTRVPDFGSQHSRERAFFRGSVVKAHFTCWKIRLGANRNKVFCPATGPTTEGRVIPFSDGSERPKATSCVPSPSPPSLVCMILHHLKPQASSAHGTLSVTATSDSSREKLRSAWPLPTKQDSCFLKCRPSDTAGWGGYLNPAESGSLVVVLSWPQDLCDHFSCQAGKGFHFVDCLSQTSKQRRNVATCVGGSILYEQMA